MPNNFKLRKVKVKYTLVKAISARGWPVHDRAGRVSGKWKRAHQAADRYVRRKYGDDVADQVNLIAARTPQGQLIGTHSRRGKIKVSKKVRTHKAKIETSLLRRAVADHEAYEHALMVGDKKRLRELRRAKFTFD
jgi:hypothetical protein